VGVAFVSGGLLASLADPVEDGADRAVARNRHPECEEDEREEALKGAGHGWEEGGEGGGFVKRAEGRERIFDQGKAAASGVGEPPTGRSRSSAV
jgi:hypothetical protein